jgi:hypothetical protein
MGKFSTVDKVPPATEPVEFEVGGTAVKCLVRHMMAEEERLVLVGAREFARQNGVQNPVATDPIYLLGLVVSTVHRGYVDADAPEELFFDGGIEQIRACLDRERIAHLWAKQADFQDRMSGIAEPAPGDGEIILWVHRLTSTPADEEAFAELRPRRMRQIMRGLALLAVRTLGLLTDVAKLAPDAAKPASDAAATG